MDTDDAGRASRPPPSFLNFDLGTAGISTVIWTTGYRLDYGWIDLPIFDAQGLPRHHRGVTEVSGRYFLGMPWQNTQASATLFGPTLDALHIAEAVGLTLRRDVDSVAS